MEPNVKRILYGLASILSTPIAFVSGFIYDSPHAGGIFTNTLVTSLATLPISFFLAIVLSFLNPKFMRLPLVNLALFILATIGLYIFQGGKFTP